MDMRIPKPLKPGDTVAVIGVSGCVHDNNREQLVRDCVQRLTALGFNVRLDPTAYAQWGYLSGTDQARADAMNRAFADDEIDGVWCVKGGYGCIRIVDMVDWDMIARHPKTFVGYSDITTFHTALHERCHLCTFHGPMPKSDHFLDQPSLDSLLHAITGSPDRVLVNPDGTQMRALRPGQAEGLLVGGNLCLVAASTGTAYDLNTKGKLLFLEDTTECVYNIDRYLFQLYQAGKLGDCAGVIFGGFTDITREYEDSFELEEVLQQVADRLHVPVIAGLQAGHLKQKLTLCLGRRYRMDADKGLIALCD